MPTEPNDTTTDDTTTPVTEAPEAAPSETPAEQAPEPAAQPDEQPAEAPAPTEPAASPSEAEAPTPEAEPAADETPAQDEQPEPPDEEPTVDPVKLTIDIEMMLYEAGMIANSLSSKSLGAALADRLYEEEQVAEGKQESRFTFAFSPFEAGMALSAISRSADGTLDELQARLTQALYDKMQELGIPPIPGQDGGPVGGGL